MKKKLFTLAAVTILSALTSSLFAFPTWHELRTGIIDYYKTVASDESWEIDSDGDLNITYMTPDGDERYAFIMSIEPEQGISDMPPAVCYFESIKPQKANAKKLETCSNAINWILPGVGHAYVDNDNHICMASTVYAFSVDYVLAQLNHIRKFSSLAIDTADSCPANVSDFYFRSYETSGFINFGNRVVKQLNEMDIKSAMEVSNNVVEFTLGDTKIRISPQGFAFGDTQFVMFGTSFSVSDMGVKPEKARHIIATESPRLSCNASRVIVSEDDGKVMVVAMMPTKDRDLEVNLKQFLAHYSVDVAVTALNLKNRFSSK